MDQLMISHHWFVYWFGKKGDKLLTEQMVTQLPDTYMYHSASMC